MDASKINDKRITKDFKSISFSGYKRTEVKKQLLQNILDGKIEDANYMCCELICCGSFMEIWETILLVVSKHIYVSNLKLPLYIQSRFENFKEIVKNGYLDDEMKMRNNDKIRLLFAEMITILVTSKKRNTISRVKVNNNQFDLTHLQSKFKANNANYAKCCITNEDPKELSIIINELCYSIEEKNNINCCFWIEWVIEYRNRCSKRKVKLHGDTRTFAPVSFKEQKDIIWIVWECLLHYANKKSPFISKLMNSLLELFCINYTSACSKKRIYLLYFAISLLIEPLQIKNQTLIENKDIVEKVKSKIDMIYKEIKKNEITPNTNYLFKGLNENHLEKSLSKIEQINSIGFIPRLNES